jgi:hypothetical protein
MKTADAEIGAETEIEIERRWRWRWICDESGDDVIVSVIIIITEYRGVGGGGGGAVCRDRRGIIRGVGVDIGIGGGRGRGGCGCSSAILLHMIVIVTGIVILQPQHTRCLTIPMSSTYTLHILSVVVNFSYNRISKSCHRILVVFMSGECGVGAFC